MSKHSVCKIKFKLNQRVCVKKTSNRIIKIVNKMLTKIIFNNLFNSTCTNSINRLKALQRNMSQAPLQAIVNEAQNLILHENENVGIITLNRPKAFNSYNLQMMHELRQFMLHFELTKSFTILRSAISPKVFCAGGDIKYLSSVDGYRGIETGYGMGHIIATYKIPFISLVDGLAFGGGFALGTYGTYNVTTENTILAMPECAAGFFTDIGSTYILSRLPGKLGLFMALTGYRISGRDAVSCGIATHYCESQKISELTDRLTHCKSDTDIRKTLDEYCSQEKVPLSFESDVERMNYCFDSESVEEIVQKLQADNSEWAQVTLKALAKQCPLSLKIVFKQYAKAAKMNRLEVFQMDCAIAHNMDGNQNFVEGVRHVLIDRTTPPKWDPSTLEAVTDEAVNRFFHRSGEPANFNAIRNVAVPKL